MEAKVKFTLGDKDAKRLASKLPMTAPDAQPNDSKGFIQKQAYNQQYKAESVNPKDMGPMSRMAMKKLGEKKLGK